MPRSSAAGIVNFKEFLYSSPLFPDSPPDPSLAFHAKEGSPTARVNLFQRNQLDFYGKRVSPSFARQLKRGGRGVSIQRAEISYNLSLSQDF